MPDIISKAAVSPRLLPPPKTFGGRSHPYGPVSISSGLNAWGRFLQYVVEQTLTGNVAEIKEYQVGIAVFPAAAFL